MNPSKLTMFLWSLLSILAHASSCHELNQDTQIFQFARELHILADNATLGDRQRHYNIIEDVY